MTETALITGCTSGIGEALAKVLAKERYDLILVARNHEKVKRLSDELSMAHGISTHIIVCDLEKPGAADYVYQQTIASGLQVSLLINNAGFNEQGDFIDTDRAQENDMIHLHAVFPTEMMKLFLPGMVQRKRGRILNVGSTGSFMPCPRDAVYAATKAYLLSVSKAINAELKGTGVTITTLCPGSTNTEFAKKAGMEGTLLFKLFVMRPDIVAAIGYKALVNGKAVVIAGIYNKILVLSSYLLPNSLMSYLTKKML